jgi:integrase
MATVRKRKWANGEAWQICYKAEGRRTTETRHSKKAADARLREIEHEIDMGVHTAKHATVTVAEALDEWVRDGWRKQKLGDLARGSVIARETSVTAIPGWLKCKLVSQVRHRDGERLVDELREKFKAHYIRNVYSALFGSIEFGVKKGWCKRNILRDQPVKRPTAERRAKIPSVGDVQALLKSCYDAVVDKAEDRSSHLAKVNRLCVFTLCGLGGLRPGEALGLQWEDIDYPAKCLRICHSYTRADGLSTPKTEAGVRTVPLNEPIEVSLELVARYWSAVALAISPEMKPRLRPLKRVRKLFLEGRGLDFERSGFVIRSIQGGPFGSSQFAQQSFLGAMTRAGLVDECGQPLFTMHALRHFYASMILGKMPLHLAKQVMGHRSIQTTVDVYGHVLKGDDRIAAASADIGSELAATTMRHRRLTD